MGLFFLSMHQNGSIKGFIEFVVAIFEKETVEPVEDKEDADSKDEGASAEDNVRFQNPVHDDERSAFQKYAASGFVGIAVAHEMMTDASSFGD